MKDKIKVTLVKVVWALEVPFYVIKLLTAFIPICFGYWVASKSKNEDAGIHLVCCMLEAVWLSGPIGLLHEYCRRKWFGICLNDEIDELAKALKERLNK
uniref:Uncharacterized protein n=1 Tax=Siphoviridae sp. ctgBD49 TaxID=2826420 RepID=A0A8S5QQ79_9CAUD|nr:MAG TPA: hypothetical protein [Siphoviridae sp. ctgBD49]